MWALRAGAGARIREAPLPGEIPTPEVGTHRRTNARRCHGNGKSSRSLKSSDFEPQIFLGKIFRARPRSAWAAPSQSWDSPSQSQDSPSHGGLGASSGFTCGRCHGSGGLGRAAPGISRIQRGRNSLFPVPAWRGSNPCFSQCSDTRNGLDVADSRFPTGFCPARRTNFRDVKLRDENGLIEQNIGKSGFPGSSECRDPTAEALPLPEHPDQVSRITELFWLEKSLEPIESNHSQHFRGHH